MTTARAIFSKHRSRIRYYDSIPANDDEHPVDAIVQRWLPHVAEHRSILSLQHRILAGLAPDALSAFLELEELRNEVAAQREEAFFDLGVGYGIERARRRQHIRRFGRSHEAALALGEALAEYLASSAEFLARARTAR